MLDIDSSQTFLHTIQNITYVKYSWQYEWLKTINLCAQSLTISYH